MVNYEKCQEIVITKCPGAESSKKLRKILLISALDLLGTLAVTIICDKNI